MIRTDSAVAKEQVDSIKIVDTLFYGQVIRIFWSSKKYLSAYYKGTRIVTPVYEFNKNFPPKTNGFKDIVIYGKKPGGAVSSLSLDSNTFLFSIEDGFKFECHLFGLAIQNNDIKFFKKENGSVMPIIYSSRYLMIDSKNKTVITTNGITYADEVKGQLPDTIGKWKFINYEINSPYFYKSATISMMPGRLRKFNIKNVSKDYKMASKLYRTVYKS